MIFVCHSFTLTEPYRWWSHALFLQHTSGLNTLSVDSVSRASSSNLQRVKNTRFPNCFVCFLFDRGIFPKIASLFTKDFRAVFFHSDASSRVWHICILPRAEEIGDFPFLFTVQTFSCLVALLGTRHRFWFDVLWLTAVHSMTSFDFYVPICFTSFLKIKQLNLDPEIVKNTQDIK